MMTRGRWCGVALFTGAVIIVILAQTRPESLGKNEDGLRRSARAESITNHRADESSLTSKTAGRMIESDWRELLEWLNSEPKPCEEEIRSKLLALRAAWSEMDPHVFADALGRLLNTGADRNTGMSFRVGPHGLLDGWTSLRVFLLDSLAAADPETAASVSRKVLDLTDSPDEYAVALRALTREGPAKAGEDELLARFQYLLEKRQWHQAGGFAETLDLARSIGNAEAGAQLLRWSGNPTLKSMALHEFAADHPAAMLESLRMNIPSDPALRANLMARLDPANADQLGALDSYLRDPQRGPEEAAIFLKSFPLRSATTGHRLYASSPAPYQIEGIAAGDRAALNLVKIWAADPALEILRPELLDLEKRLTQWVEQTK